MSLIEILLGLVLLSTVGGTEENARYSRQLSQPRSQFRPPQHGQPQGQYPPPNSPPQQGQHSASVMQPQRQQQFANPMNRQLPPGMRWPSDSHNVMEQNPGQLPGQQLPPSMPMTNQQPSGQAQVPISQEVLEGVYRMSDEIVEAVVERLEEDEAMAIELEKQGFDPDVYSLGTIFTSHALLLSVNLIILMISHL